MVNRPARGNDEPVGGTIGRVAIGNVETDTVAREDAASIGSSKAANLPDRIAVEAKAIIGYSKDGEDIKFFEGKDRSPTVEEVDALMFETQR